MLVFMLCSLSASASELSIDPAEALHEMGVDTPDAPALWDSIARLATPSGQAHVQASLDRYADHRRVVQRALATHDVPEALAALPVVESGYRNLDASPNLMGAAGLWQFIPPTARTYGLRVDDQVDERLDVRKASDAAARLLADLHDRYGDWGLALSAYNHGPRRVDAAIEAHDTADVWSLIELGALAPYPADVLAAMAAWDHLPAR